MLMEQHFLLYAFKANDVQCLHYYLFPGTSASLDEKTSFSLLNKRSSLQIHTHA